MRDLKTDIKGFNNVCRNCIGKEFNGLTDEESVSLIQTFSKKKLSRYGFILYDGDDKLILFDLEDKIDLKRIKKLYQDGKINLYTYRLTYFY